MAKFFHIQALTQFGIEKDTFLWEHDAKSGFRYCASLSNGFNRIYYILDGNVEFKTKNETRRIQSGKLYIFPANTDYTLVQKVFGPFKHIYFHVQLEEPINDFTSFDINENSYVFQLLTFMEKCIDDTEPNYATQLFELLLSKLFAYDINEVTENQIFNAKRYLDSNLTAEKMCISKLTDVVFLDSKYFIKRFKKTYNKSPMQYYNDEKLKSAYSDLLNGLTPTQVTDKYNYSSLSNFSLKFKKKFGFPPSKCIKYNTKHKYLK